MKKILTISLLMCMVILLISCSKSDESSKTIDWLDLEMLRHRLDAAPDHRRRGGFLGGSSRAHAATRGVVPGARRGDVATGATGPAGG